MLLLVVVVVLVLMEMVPMEGILTEVRPATLMEEIKQRGGGGGGRPLSGGGGVWGRW